VRDVALHQQLQAEAEKEYEAVRKTIEGLASIEESGAYAKLDLLAVGRAHVASGRLERIGEHLEILGEPAGADWRLRSAAQRNWLTDLIRAARDDPAVQQKLTAGHRVLTAEIAKQAKQIPKASRLAKAEEWEQAHTAVQEMCDRWRGMAVWYYASRLAKLTAPFDEPLRVTSTKVRELRTKESIESLEAAFAEALPDYDAVLAEVAAVRGPSLDGPAALERITQQWIAIQTQSLHALALDWTLTAVRKGATDAQIKSRHEQFSGEMVDRVAQLIEADAARVNASSARELYPKYLEAIANLGLLISREHELKLSAALEGLVAKSPGLASEIAHYEAATSDLLRWRRRLADARQQAQATADAALSTVIVEGTRATASRPGFLPARGSSADQLKLALLPAALEASSAKIVGRSVVVEDLIGMEQGSPISIGRYRDRSYSRVRSFDPAAELQLLEADLLVRSGARPLTYEAARALASAGRGSYLAAGGKVTTIALEALDTRFATLPTAGVVLLPLDRLPEERETGLDQMLLRVDVAADWVRHEYFFATNPR
jgi:hypothetical protein